MKMKRLLAVSARLQPGDRLVAEADIGKAEPGAILVAKAGRGLAVRSEQDYPAHEECPAGHRQIPPAFVRDENIGDRSVSLRAGADLAMDVVNPGIRRPVGLAKSRPGRGRCVSTGIGLTLENPWRGDISTGANAHLAHVTPTELLFTTTDFNSYGPVSIADGAQQRGNGRMAASTSPGLGPTPKMNVLGNAVVVVT